MNDGPTSLLRICPECNYDLRGAAHERCPECGLDLSFMQAEHSTIPWCDPRRGRVSAFVQTALLATSRPKRLLREVFRPVDYHAAQRFRWTCVLLAFGSLLLAGGAALWVEPGLWQAWRSLAGTWFVFYFAACVLLLLIFLSGGHTYFFHPKRLSVEHQNRTLALSYYASAPLGLLPCVTLLLPLCILLPGANDTDLKLTALLVVVGVACALVWLGIVVLASTYARHLLGRGRARWTVGLLTLLAMVISHLVCLAALPAAALYVGLMYYSMWAG